MKKLLFLISILFLCFNIQAQKDAQSLTCADCDTILVKVDKSNYVKVLFSGVVYKEGTTTKYFHNPITFKPLSEKVSVLHDALGSEVLIYWKNTIFKNQFNFQNYLKTCEPLTAVDLCENVTCAENEVCESGECIPLFAETTAIKTGNSSIASIDDIISYTIEVCNTGNIEDTNVQLDDVLDSNLEFVGTSIFPFIIASLPPNECETITYDVQLTDEAKNNFDFADVSTLSDLSNTVNITSDNSEESSSTTFTVPEPCNDCITYITSDNNTGVGAYAELLTGNLNINNLQPIDGTCGVNEISDLNDVSNLFQGSGTAYLGTGIPNLSTDWIITEIKTTCTDEFCNVVNDNLIITLDGSTPPNKWVEWGVESDDLVNALLGTDLQLGGVPVPLPPNRQELGRHDRVSFYTSNCNDCFIESIKYSPIDKSGVVAPYFLIRNFCIYYTGTTCSAPNVNDVINDFSCTSTMCNVTFNDTNIGQLNCSEPPTYNLGELITVNPENCCMSPTITVTNENNVSVNLNTTKLTPQPLTTSENNSTFSFDLTITCADGTEVTGNFVGTWFNCVESLVCCPDMPENVRVCEALSNGFSYVYDQTTGIADFTINAGNASLNSPTVLVNSLIVNVTLPDGTLIYTGSETTTALSASHTGNVSVIENQIYVIEGVTTYSNGETIVYRGLARFVDNGSGTIVAEVFNMSELNNLSFLISGGTCSTDYTASLGNNITIIPTPNVGTETELLTNSITYNLGDSENLGTSAFNEHNYTLNIDGNVITLKDDIYLEFCCN